MSKPLSPVQVIALASGKGGVGKTQAAINLAFSLAARGRRVMLVDAAFALPEVAVSLGLAPPRTLAQVLAGDCTLAEAIQPVGELQLLAGSSLDPLPDARQLAGLIQAFSTLAQPPQVLLIDCSPGLGADVRCLLRAASEVLLVVSDEPAARAAALALLRRLNSAQGLRRVRLLASMTQNAAEGRALHERLLQQIDDLDGIALDYLGAVPQDDTLRRAVQRQGAVCELQPRSRIAQTYARLAETIDGWPLPANPRGHLEFFIEHLVAAQYQPRPRPA
ncbi:AAA family ATPase [Pseudomonas sp. NW5]|uniref:nucleotide-binding protein n=1 Tax=Pseudomonas sp. NW5 TaxID=2934934 RepID=UPI0020225022|nr:AAA family ATPase [Pseudomonas sp. NW5]MCL7461713.1 AAA family ATPase [Pseudomonas sp. NW5]